MLVVLLALTVLAAGETLTAPAGDSFGGALPRLPAGFSPEVEAPPPLTGEDVPSSPSRGWWASGGSHPPETSPRNTAGGPATFPATPLALAGAIPFISANPAVPLPTAETDVATLYPQEAVVGLGGSRRARMLLLLVTITMLRAFGV